jgi:hypothetical protein
MTRDEMIEMARKAGSLIEIAQEKDLLWLESFAALVASAERKACAEICKKHADVYAMLEQNPTAKSAWAACIDTRDAIRARP